MPNRALLLLAISLFLPACEYNPENSAAPNKDPALSTDIETAAENKLALVCDNGYSITATYHHPDDDGFMSQLSLEINKDGKTQKIDMVPSSSASGAKFETQDQKMSFWEHHDEFTLAIGEQDVSVCKEPLVQEKYTTQTGKTFIVKEDSSTSASASKITIIGKGFGDADITIGLDNQDLVKDPIIDTFLADLNQDGYEELYITTTSTDENNYGNLYGFASVNDKNIVPIALPKLSDADKQKGAHFEGYQGSDDFYAEDKLLVREFPIYPNNNKTSPASGMKRVFYALTPGETSWQLGIVKSEKVE